MSHQGFTLFVLLLLLLITPYSCVGNIREAGTTWGGTPEYLYMLFGRFHMHAKIPHPSEVHRFYPFLNNADKEHKDVRERSLPPPIVPARGKALASRPATGQLVISTPPPLIIHLLVRGSWVVYANIYLGWFYSIGLPRKERHVFLSIRCHLHPPAISYIPIGLIKIEPHRS